MLWLVPVVLGASFIHIGVGCVRPRRVLLLVSGADMAQTEAHSAKLDDVIQLSFVALLAELTEWEPDLGVRVLEILLIELVTVVNPIKVVFSVDKRYAWIIIKLLVALVNHFLHILKALELDAVREPIYLNYTHSHTIRQSNLQEFLV